MSKMKIIDEIADAQVDYVKESLYDSIQWAMAGVDELEDLEGDNYNFCHNAIMMATIEKLHANLKEIYAEK